jgi:uncharacterized secreted protein with C-terminal beta-propeller domain
LSSNRKNREDGFEEATMQRTAQWVAALAALALAAAACTGGSGDTAHAATLTSFEECGQLRDYFVGHAVEMVGPYGLDGGPARDVLDGPEMTEDAGQPQSEGDAAESAAPAPSGAADGRGSQEPVQGSDYSGTNIQEAGVDEPDVVKTDGQRLLAVQNERLHVLDVTGGSPQRVGEVGLPEGRHEILLAGDRALMLTRGHDTAQPMSELSAGVESSDEVAPPRRHGEVSTLTLVELADEPTIAETMQFDGAYVSARMVEGNAHVVVRTQAPVGLDFTTPEGTGLRAEREATQRNEEILRNSEVDNWLPYAVRTDADGDASESLLLDCDDVHRPQSFSGLGLAAAVTVDVDDGLGSAEASAVVGAGETVYASPSNLYVATQQDSDRAREREDAPSPQQATTQIHQFSLAETPASYAASGQVPGRLLNQWALSEHDGHLRVATTQGELRGRRDGAPASESAVRVLRRDGGQLEQVGAVTGLGKGERIYAVRYSGDIGYVVTFRRTDPLYTVDLSEPANPRVRGELKILGYSSYLHPIGDDLLLGVGQDADKTGRTRGTQVSVFDVSDLSEPTRLAKTTLAHAHSRVEDDHRALLHWPADDLTVIPVQQRPRPVEPMEEPRVEPERDGSAQTSPPRPAEGFVGAIAYELGADGIAERGRVTHPATQGRPAAITRSLVVGDTLYTVSEAGVQANDVSTLAQQAWLAW